MAISAICLVSHAQNPGKHGDRTIMIHLPAADFDFKPGT